MKVLKWLDEHFEETLMTLVLAIMVVILTAQIVFRKVLGNSLAWSEELCRYLFIWSGFLSLSYTLHNHSAMKTDLFIAFFPQKIQKWIAFVMNVGMFVLFVILTKVSVAIIPTITQRGTAIPISRKWVFMAAAAGFFLSSLRMLEELVKGLKNMEDKNKEHESKKNGIKERKEEE